MILDLGFSCLMIEYDDDPMVLDQTVGRKAVVSCQLSCVDAAGDLGLLEDPQVQVGL